jgi:hypothetical protein
VKLEKRDGASGPNVVSFEGYPVSQMVSKKSIKWDEGQDFRVDVDVNPAGTSGGYIVRSYCNFALQYDPKNSNISLIVWLIDGKGDAVSVKAPAENWTTLTAQLSNGELSITANGETKTKKLASGSVLIKTAAPLWVACNQSNAENILRGKIGKLRVSKLP